MNSQGLLNVDYDEGIDSDDETEQEGEHVQVLCRVRKPLGSELQEQLAIKTDVAARQILLEDKAFTFDHVLDSESTQQHVFERIRPLVTSLLDGYSGCIFAYGQTGAGKTYTMDGTESEPGVYMRSIQELVHAINQRGGEHTLEMSIFEIYNELIYDLLNLDTDPRLLRLAKTDEGLTIANLSRHVIRSAEEGRRLIQLGHKHRSVTSTKMNAVSSRSHCVVSIRVRSKAANACLMLIDLAGSERVKASQVSGAAMGETIAINKSLSSLALVIHALARRTSHVPWRASQLTRALAPALLGTARIAIIIALSPAAAHATESLAALRFAVSAKAVVRPVPVPATPSLDLSAWRDVVKQLQDELRMKQEQISVLLQQNEELKQQNIRLTRRAQTASDQSAPAPRIQSPARESRGPKSALRDPARSYAKKGRVIFPPFQCLESVCVPTEVCDSLASDTSDDELSQVRKRKFEEITPSLPMTPVRHQVKRVRITPAQPPKPLAPRTASEMNMQSVSSPWSAGSARRVQVKHQGTPLKAQSLARTARTRLVVSSDN